jgi:D-glycero-D-manno-heptose 1,7-bisphosphate phosphatase
VIGDSLRDLESAQAVGAVPMLVRTGKGERTLARLAESPQLANVPVFTDLAAAVDALLAGTLIV